MPLSIDSIVRLVLLAGLAAICAVIVQPFVQIFLWSAILAVVLHPLYIWLQRRLAFPPALAAALLAFVGLVVMLGPVAALTAALLSNLAEIFDLVRQTKGVVTHPPAYLFDLPVVGRLLEPLWDNQLSNVNQLAKEHIPELTSLSRQLLEFTLAKGLSFLKMLASLVTAAVMLVFSEPLMRGLEILLRKLVPDNSSTVLRITITTVRNVSLGVVGVAFGQAILIGLGLLVAGVPWAGLLSLLALILGLIQIGPTPAVLLALLLAWNGLAPLPATLLTLWLIPVTLLDNVLKPLLMARGLPVPMLVILLGVLGGTLKAGLIGLFLGPVLLSLGYHFLRLWVDINESKLIEIP